MSDSSRVESIFSAALEKPTEEERAAYLARACGADDALRRRVERLLEAHPQAVGFLDRPAIAGPEHDDRTGPGPADPPDSTEVVDPDTDGPDDEPGALALLEPSKAAGSLGRLAHYEVLAVLGQGTFGTVVKAFDGKLHRYVAIKILAPVLATTSPPRRRFVREARSAAAVSHENVVAIHAVEDDPIPYLVMEYVPGQTLQQRLDAGGPLPLGDVLRIGQQIAAGLAAAHATGLVHRDITPGNILLEEGVDRVKITDFGLARAGDDAAITRPGFLAGTPLYMAPEQALGEAVDQRADLFSLGSVLYAMCTGRPPFRAGSALAVLKRVAEETPRPVREDNPDIPEWLGGLISGLHARNPADRCITARDVADLLASRLTELRRGGVPSAVRPAAAPRSWRAKPRPARPVRAGIDAVFVGPGPGEPARPPRSRLLWAGVVAIPTILFGSGLGEATGLTNVQGTIIRLFGADGTLVVEVDDPEVRVRLSGADLVIEGAGVREIRLRPGQYTLEALRDGRLVRRELVEVTRNGRRVVRVGKEPQPQPPAPTGAASPPTDATRDALKAADAASWERAVSKLSAVERAKAVALRLQELNPGFDGAITVNIEHGVVRDLAFCSDHVSNLSPVRALTGLRSLDCSGSDAFSGQFANGAPARPDQGGTIQLRSVARSRLVDLSPLNGLPLTRLVCVNTNVYDLSPIAGMKLVELRVASSMVHDLSPLRGMPLERLDCSYTRVADLAPLEGMSLTMAGFESTEVADLSPLRGMPLTILAVGRGVTDLSPLKGMPLIELVCSGSRISDLTPLRGLPIGLLAIGDTQVKDLSPLRGMTSLKRLFCCDLAADLSPLRGLALEYLHAGPLVTDLSPLQGMPLNKLDFQAFAPARDSEILRAIPTLEIINDLPASQFWEAAH